MTFQGENLFVGLIALALLPVIGWRIRRGIRDGELPLYRTRIARDEAGAAKFNFLLALHVVAMLLVAVIAADLLLGLGLRAALGLPA